MIKIHKLPRDFATRYPLQIYDLFISVIAICSIALLLWQMFFQPQGETRRLLELVDYFFCFLFFTDYIRCIFRAENRLKYIFTWGILDLASSIPALPALRFLRIARLVRVLMVIRSFRILTKVVVEDSIASTVTVTTLIGCLIIVGSCIGVLHYEQQSPHANLTNAEDVAWWAVVTTSTVGYGDFYPVTNGGRLFAVLIMCVGIGLFATFAGALLSTLVRHLRSGQPETPAERFKELTRQNRLIMEKLEALEEKINPQGE
ncbi:MAG: ion transporter [Mariniblastus sp.]|nr:ion transporter [Mariniblastus sp.]